MILLGVVVVIFGPQVGRVDYIALAAIYLTGLAVLRPPLRLSRDMKVLVVIQAAYLAYVYLIYLVTGQTDTYLLGRTHRMLLSTVLLGVTFSTLPVSPIRVLNMVMVGLVLHALMVFYQIVDPGLRDAIGRLYGFSAYFVQYRAIGLTSGYDGASLLAVVGMVFSALRLFIPGANPLWAALVLTFALATFLTGRTGMIISVVVLTLHSLHFTVRGRGIVRFVSFLFLAGTVAVAIIVVRVILVQTVPETREWLGEPMIAVDRFILQDQWAPHTGEVLVTMITLPATTAGTLFGTGAAPNVIDIGYIRMIYMTGLVGLLAVGAVYGFMLWRLKNFSRGYRSLGTPEGARLTVVSSGLSAALLVMALYNAKSLFFFARSSHELFMIIFAALAADVARRKVGVLSASLRKPARAQSRPGLGQGRSPRKSWTSRFCQQSARGMMA